MSTTRPRALTVPPTARRSQWRRSHASRGETSKVAFRAARPGSARGREDGGKGLSAGRLLVGTSVVKEAGTSVRVAGNRGMPGASAAGPAAGSSYDARGIRHDGLGLGAGWVARGGRGLARPSPGRLVPAT